MNALNKKLGIEEYIQFTDFIPEEELPDYYRIADVFILPTQELEGFGIFKLEAMASGVPILGTPIKGTKEILGQFSYVFLLRDNGPDPMAALIIESCRRTNENAEIWQAISDQCRRFVENNYSWEKM